MRRISCIAVLPLGLLAIGLLDCGGSSPTPEDTCNQVMAVMCQRMSDCGQLGTTSVADCTKSMQAANCSSASISLVCPAGSTFHSSEAQKCIDEQRSQSCTDLSSGVEPDACTQVCTIGGGGGGTSGGGTSGSGGMGGGGTGGTSSPGALGALDACKQTMAIMCQKTSTCLGSTGLSDLGGYTSVGSCTTDMQARGCADVTQSSCAAGEGYHADQAQTCLGLLPSISCTDFSNGTFPSACNLMCQ